MGKKEKATSPGGQAPWASVPVVLETQSQSETHQPREGLAPHLLAGTPGERGKPFVFICLFCF